MFWSTHNYELCVTLVKVLDALATASGHSLNLINIVDFFDPRLAINRMDRFLQVIGRFKELRYLIINFNCLSEVLVRNLAATCSGKLRNLFIKVRNGGQLSAIRSPIVYNIIYTEFRYHCNEASHKWVNAIIIYVNLGMLPSEVELVSE